MKLDKTDETRLAVLIPCYNEELTVAKVVGDFARALPGASIFVYDNNSTDSTVACATEAGAIVRRESRQGKGNVVSRMFSDVDADVYILVDGDATYDASLAPQLVAHIEDGIDVVNVRRVGNTENQYRAGHQIGNKLLTGTVRRLFGAQFSDMLSGYKAFSRRFVKSFPALSSGFEIETELTIHALRLRMPTLEIAGDYFERPEGSFSKLSTFRDGFRILGMIARMLKNEKPLTLFGILGTAAMVLGLCIFIPILDEFLTTRLVLRVPSLLVAVGVGTIGFSAIALGFILDAISSSKRELKRLEYLSVKQRVK